MVCGSMKKTFFDFYHHFGEGAGRMGARL